MAKFCTSAGCNVVLLLFFFFSPCDGIPRMQKLRSRAIKGSLFTPGTWLNLALHTSPSASTSDFLISALPVHLKKKKSPKILKLKAASYANSEPE